MQVFKDHEKSGRCEIIKGKRNKAQITKFKETKICKLPNKELNIIILKELSELQENTDKEMKPGKQYMSKMRCSIQRQKTSKRIKQKF